MCCNFIDLVGYESVSIGTFIKITSIDVQCTNKTIRKNQKYSIIGEKKILWPTKQSIEVSGRRLCKWAHDDRII